MTPEIFEEASIAQTSLRKILCSLHGLNHAAIDKALEDLDGVEDALYTVKRDLGIEKGQPRV